MAITIDRSEINHNKNKKQKKAKKKKEIQYESLEELDEEELLEKICQEENSHKLKNHKFNNTHNNNGIKFMYKNDVISNIAINNDEIMRGKSENNKDKIDYGLELPMIENLQDEMSLKDDFFCELDLL